MLASLLKHKLHFHYNPNHNAPNQNQSIHQNNNGRFTTFVTLFSIAFAALNSVNAVPNNLGLNATQLLNLKLQTAISRPPSPRFRGKPYLKPRVIISIVSPSPHHRFLNPVILTARPPTTDFFFDFVNATVVIGIMSATANNFPAVIGHGVSMTFLGPAASTSPTSTRVPPRSTSSLKGSLRSDSFRRMGYA
ncbi:hypothetical protein BC938DRAFT_474236 [Jimgerdemannia flammicorona]|uniref:Uncharacterized protein n=1 Tax=Jimgerdemannia flammicorona TaxID=994334 RepID=A0A433QSR6_9FUNG|nr:hypothetical protein BC938DRAFT_474236 [Jimgerdemannia flammicorona]